MEKFIQEAIKEFEDKFDNILLPTYFQMNDAPRRYLIEFWNESLSGKVKEFIGKYLKQAYELGKESGYNGRILAGSQDMKIWKKGEYEKVKNQAIEQYKKDLIKWYDENSEIATDSRGYVGFFVEYVKFHNHLNNKQ